MQNRPNRRLYQLLLALFIVVFCQQLFSEASILRKKHTTSPYKEYMYQQKVLRKLEKDKYKASLLPVSGFMTKEEYENSTKDVETASMSIPEPKLPKDIKMKYVPQPTYKLTRYNNPPGTVEIRMDRSLRFDRQENGLGVASPAKTIMVYPAVYYYAISKTTSSDVFVIPLDQSLPDVDRLLRANVVRRDPNPILSTDKSIDSDYSFKTMTPVDFSTDGLRLIAKEKIGYSYDGIWQTNLWVYDFETKKAKNLVEIRDAIKFYWLETKGIRLDEKRWDIFPLGFDAEDPARIIVTAYAYTGNLPKFLGTWSIDYKGEQTQLISLFDSTANVSMNGFKLVRSGVVNPSEVFADEKRENKKIKAKRRAEKRLKRKNARLKKAAYHKKIKEMKREAHENSKFYAK